jgi:hypothetical protein
MFDFAPMRLAALLLLVTATASSAGTVTLQPVADNSLYQGNLAGEATGTFEDNSCGAGPYLFSGVTLRSWVRRALLEFDIAGNIPAGSTIDGVTLTLNVNLTRDTLNRNMILHPVTQDCGLNGGGQGMEANPGDTIWLDAKFQSLAWASAGGDFGASSATASVPPVGNAVWDSTTEDRRNKRRIPRSGNAMFW